MIKYLRCQHCSSDFALEPLFQGCPRCGGALEVAYDYAALAPQLADMWGRSPASQTGIWHYAPLLPINDPAEAISLGEGNTPLLQSRRVGPAHGLSHLYFKNETVNPTWAQNDRCHTVMMSKAREYGYRRATATSTGNHGASAAAYSAAAGLDACVVFCPPETSDLLLRFINHFGGTALISDWDGRAALLNELVTEHGWYPATGMGAGPGTNPYGVEGYKSLAYEIVEQLGGAPDRVLMGVASGDSFYGVWKGFRELHQLGRIAQPPRMWGCQPSGADVLARSLAEQRDEPLVLEAPASIATSTREPTTGAHALRAIRESHGGATIVDDAAILEAMKLLGREGVCGEPASALPLAVALQLVDQGDISADERIVCVVTAAGIKWPGMLEQVTPAPRHVAPTIPALEDTLIALGLMTHHAHLS